MAKTVKAQARIPIEMGEEIQRLADERFGGSNSNAVAFLLAAGLKSTLGIEVDDGIQGKVSEDDVAPFRDYLIDEHGYKPRTATISASIVRGAFRSGDLQRFIEGHPDPKVRSNRTSIWRLWTEFCLVNNLDPMNVRVAGMSPTG